MLLHHHLALLLWRLRRQPALYMLGAGASAPIVPFSPALMQRAAWDYVHLGAFPVVRAPRTQLTDRVKAEAKGVNFYPNREVRPGTPEVPTGEILLRLSHGGASASLMYYLSQSRFEERRVTNYTVLRAFYPSLIMNYNLDGLSADICGAHHRVVNVHGTIESWYGGPSGAKIMRLAQEYGIEIAHDGLVLCGPESFTSVPLRKKLEVMLRSNPAFVMFIGYSFGKNDTSYDDHVTLERFIARFRGVPIDVYVLDPHPSDLTEMLRERLGSNRVHALPVYWNLLAEAFTQVLLGQLCSESLDHFHGRLLDDHGPGIVFPRDQ